MALDAGLGFAAGHQGSLLNVDALDAVDDRPAERVGDAHPHLVVACVRRLVAEQDEIERSVSGLDVDDGCGDR